MNAFLFDLGLGLLLGFSLTIPPGPMNAYIASQSVRSFREGVTAGLGAMSADLALGILIYGLHSEVDLTSGLRSDLPGRRRGDGLLGGRSPPKRHSASAPRDPGPADLHEGALPRDLEPLPGRLVADGRPRVRVPRRPGAVRRALRRHRGVDRGVPLGRAPPGPNADRISRGACSSCRASSSSRSRDTSSSSPFEVPARVRRTQPDLSRAANCFRNLETFGAMIARQYPLPGFRRK